MKTKPTIDLDLADTLVPLTAPPRKTKLNYSAGEIHGQAPGTTITGEMVDHFERRTKEHIWRVQKFMQLMIDAGLAPEWTATSAAAHDASKFRNPERQAYILISWQYWMQDQDQEFTPTEDEQQLMLEATLHHIKSNPHHPEYHDPAVGMINEADRDQPGEQITDASRMPAEDIAEMVADWMAMSEEKGTDLREWADQNVNIRWKFTEDQTQLIYNLVTFYETNDHGPTLNAAQDLSRANRFVWQPGEITITRPADPDRSARFVWQPGDLMPVGSSRDRIAANYDPDQPRDPAGTETGGQWTRSAGPGRKREYREFPQADREQMSRWGTALFDESQLDDDEMEALRHYKGSGYSSINGMLRDPSYFDYVRNDQDRKEREEHITAIVEAMDRAMGSAVIEDDIVVYRGLNPGLAENLFSHLKEGDEFRDEGFLSTSMRIDVALQWGVYHIVEIRVPSGSRGLYLDDQSINLDDSRGEEEILFPRGSRMQYIGRREEARENNPDWHYTRIIMELVP